MPPNPTIVSRLDRVIYVLRFLQFDPRFVYWIYERHRYSRAFPIPNGVESRDSFDFAQRQFPKSSDYKLARLLKSGHWQHWLPHLHPRRPIQPILFWVEGKSRERHAISWVLECLPTHAATFTPRINPQQRTARHGKHKRTTTNTSTYAFMHFPKHFEASQFKILINLFECGRSHICKS